jgi:hypothetical protein
MEAVFVSGHIADIMLAVLAIEFLGLVVYRRATGRGPTIAAIAPTMLAGGFLVIALRTALVGAPWTWTGLALAAALAAHVFDLAGRRNG